jgi:hypothetical protein
MVGKSGKPRQWISLFCQWLNTAVVAATAAAIVNTVAGIGAI